MCLMRVNARVDQQVTLCDEDYPQTYPSIRPRGSKIMRELEQALSTLTSIHPSYS